MAQPGSRNTASELSPGQHMALASERRRTGGRRKGTGSFLSFFAGEGIKSLLLV